MNHVNKTGFVPLDFGFCRRQTRLSFHGRKTDTKHRKKKNRKMVKLTCGDGTTVTVNNDDAAKASEMIATRLEFPGRDDKEALVVPEIRSGRVLKIVASCMNGSPAGGVRETLEKASWNLIGETAQAADYLVMESLLAMAIEVLVTKSRSVEIFSDWGGLPTTIARSLKGTSVYEGKDPNLIDYYYCNCCGEDGKEVTLMQCARCKVCQKQDFKSHKEFCKYVDKTQKETARRTEEVQNNAEWGNLFETGVGRFYSIADTREYCMARFGYADAIKGIAW